MRDQSLQAGSLEAARVVSSVLRLILELRQDETDYDRGKPLGTELYYVMNIIICWHNESLLTTRWCTWIFACLGLVSGSSVPSRDQSFGPIVTI